MLYIKDEGINSLKVVQKCLENKIEILTPKKKEKEYTTPQKRDNAPFMQNDKDLAETTDWPWCFIPSITTL